MNKFLVPLLGGNWSRADGAVQAWKRQTYKLRHLCAHGGYFPSTVEAAAASDSSDEVATFLFNRLGDKRTEFPRTCMMTLAQSGLERRNQWDARIQRFTENEAKQEPNWNLSLKTFRDEVESLRQR